MHIKITCGLIANHFLPLFTLQNVVIPSLSVAIVTLLLVHDEVPLPQPVCECVCVVVCSCCRHLSMCAIIHTLIPARKTNKRMKIKACKEPGGIDSEGTRTEGLKGGWGRMTVIFLH